MIEHAATPGAWAGERCYILGGGPSLTGVDVWRLRGRVVAVNNAYQLRPDADVLYFADRRWYHWHRERLHAFHGTLLLTRRILTARDGGPRLAEIRHIGRDAASALSLDPAKLAGWCSGANAINYAWLQGASPIILLGFDGHGANWHAEHQVINPPGHLQRHSVPSLEAMAAELNRRGARVINATIGSLIRGFPIEGLDSWD